MGFSYVGCCISRWGKSPDGSRMNRFAIYASIVQDLHRAFDIVRRVIVTRYASEVTTYFVAISYILYISNTCCLFLSLTTPKLFSLRLTFCNTTKVARLYKFLTLLCDTTKIMSIFYMWHFSIAPQMTRPFEPWGLSDAKTERNDALYSQRGCRIC